MDTNSLIKEAIDNINKATSSEELESYKAKYLGGGSEINRYLKTLGAKSPEERKKHGIFLNKAKSEINDLLRVKINEINSKELEPIDISTPGLREPLGKKHPISVAIDEIAEIFARLGFIRRRYNEIETDWYNFEGLNIQKDHPARDEQETFYLKNGLVLSTHTSSGQLREMDKGKLPIRMININRCYRRQSDITHTPSFHQFEGLAVDKNISITDLKGTIDYFFKSFFGPNTKSRIRPYNFRFTEPSFEVDVSCTYCDGNGCAICKEGWLEMGGAGMVHREVLKNGGISPSQYSGFAFGVGVERCVLIRSGIPDLRLLYTQDIRILERL